MSYYQEQQIRQQFLDEAEEYVKIIESGLIGLASRPLESDRLEAMGRACHSLKGGAGLMNYLTLSDLAHTLEDCFNGFYPGYICDRLETEQLLLESVDCFNYCITQYRQGAESIDENWLTEKVNPLFSLIQQNLPSLVEDDFLETPDLSSQDIRVLMFETEVEGCLQRLEAVAQSEEKHCLREEFQLASQELAGLAEMLELTSFQSLCQEIEREITEALVENLEEIVTLALKQWRKSQTFVLNQQFALIPLNLEKTQSAIVTTSVESEVNLPQPVLTEHNLRVSAEKLAQIEELFGELIIERNGLNLQLKQLFSLVQLLKQRVGNLDQSNRSLRTLYDHAGQLIPAHNNRHWDSLELDSYTELHPVFQELMETIVQIQEVTGDIELNLDLTQKAAKGLSRTSGLVQTNITQVRLRPFADLVRLFPRAIREMTLKHGKQVDLIVKGESTLIDRTILDALNEPLIHLLRNAFDHGIEAPELRQALGKNPSGCISIEARQRGNLIIITVQDDGQGINLDKIRQKVPQNLSDEKLLDLIFEPGFSTADQVTELSGRGLGMDIVRRQLQQVRGQIQVSTEPGKGTTFTIIIPFTLSVVRVLLVESGKMLMAIPISVVEEMLVITSEMRVESLGQNLLNWDGEIIPLLNLSPWLNFNPLTPESRTDARPIINQPIVLIIAQGNRLFALEMDRYWGEQEVTIRSLEGVLPLPKGLTGCTIMGDGSVVPLADPVALIQWLEQNHPDHLPVTPPVLPPEDLIPVSETRTYKRTVMVVDDSINVRRFLALTLEKVGYRVEQAKDGQEALEKLNNSNIELVICDIEMPRLDGYGFLNQVRSHPQYQSLPVIMLTSRSGEKHRQTAMSLGATAYFSKPFQEQVLLATLKSL
ncbi:hybrid sensor histidine kinase/response regulator [Gloeocapsa sp. PCC 73106]|uniref:hybrid sensor histidine kinase/response regulator n=1 Tax=Gloeocapsa sp. PCC 73106 TaxID=102232 RepID=UPI0002ACEC32|nr:hybrid sensor histidine kinase/response regulator [Gloeocapsa sp. PCC 73106]ELR96850.1 chemotaxis protein histidine kinase-like protein [Gloeocapsa sp. PCC 73106]